MSLLAVRLDTPHHIVRMDSTLEGAHHLYLINWKGTGMTNGNPTLFLRVSGQDMHQVYGNVGDRIPLIFEDSGTNPCVAFENQYKVTGKVGWKGSNALGFHLENYDGTPAQFTTMDLVMRVVEAAPEQQYFSELQANLWQY